MKTAESNRSVTWNEDDVMVEDVVSRDSIRIMPMYARWYQVSTEIDRSKFREN